MIGTRVANYSIQEKLGQGGMGVVYKAIDLNLDRPVAIKALPPELARDPDLVERFRHEAKALANLNHVNIATLYSLQEANGQYLMVMEYLEGIAFDRLIQQRGRIPCDEAIRLFKQALLGIGYAHRRGVVHRDIKPSNIMLTSAGIVKVMDFGIAKVLGGQRLTRTGAQMGTVAYMSPEQIRNQPVDARSDIYSLSVTLFEMLTGRLPFAAGSDFELMSAHLQTPPPRLRQLCPDLGQSLESAVLRGLEKTPGMRFQTAEEFGAALEQRDGAPQRVSPAVAQQSAKAAPVPPAQAPAAVSPAKPASPPAGSFAKPVSPPPRSVVKHASPPYQPGAGKSPVPADPARASPLSHVRSRKGRSPVQAFLSLAFGVAVLFCLFFGGLYRESVPMLLACAVLLYFLPILIAAILLKRNGAAVVKLNALRGWTGIGWIQAMKQALANDE